MIYTSLAVVALSASAAVSPLSRLVHLHSHSAESDTRIAVTLHNKSSIFQDVKVDGQSYTLLANQDLTVKAPAGTLVYAASATGMYHRGDVLVAMTPELNHQTIELN